MQLSLQYVARCLRRWSVVMWRVIQTTSVVQPCDSDHGAIKDTRSQSMQIVHPHETASRATHAACASYTGSLPASTAFRYVLHT